MGSVKPALLSSYLGRGVRDADGPQTVAVHWNGRGHQRSWWTTAAQDHELQVCRMLIQYCWLFGSLL